MANDSLASKQISPADLKTVLEALKLIDTILKPNLIALTPDQYYGQFLGINFEKST